MKRKGLLFVALLLLSVFSLCFIACGDNNNNTNGDNPPHTHSYVGGLCKECGEVEQRSTEGLTFTLINNDLEYEVSGYTGSSTEVYISSTYNSKPITSIGERAFYCNSVITSIKIPDSVTIIGDSAFQECTSLIKVTIGDSVTSIGKEAFDWCSSITSITIPDSVISIGWQAFIYCKSLISVTIGRGVTSIGESAFYYCPSLTNITVDANNLVYKSINGDLYSKDGKELIQYAIGKTVTSFSVPDGVTIIGVYAFYGCNFLISITIPDSVTGIVCSAFSSCNSLTSVTFSDTSTWYGMRFSIDAYEKWLNKMGGTEIDVTDASNNAGYFKSTYVHYYLYKI